MSLKTKLTIALSVSLALVVGLGWFLFRSKPQRESVDVQSRVIDVKDSSASDRELDLVAAPTPVVVAPPARTAGATGHAVFAEDEVWLLTGRTVRIDESGQSWPVGGVRIDLGPHPRRTRPEEAPPPRRAVTAEDGRFELQGCPGRLWMRLDIDEPASAWRAFSFQLGDPDASGRRDLGDIPLEPALTLAVELVGASDEPIEHGQVLVGRDDSVKGLALDELKVRDSRREARELGGGKYLLERTGAGLHSLKIFAPGHAGAKHSVVVPHEGPVVVRLARGKQLAGKVLAADGKPLPGAVVELNSGPGLSEPDPTTRTDEAGAFRFDILSDGEYEVEAWAEGYTKAKLRKVAAGIETVEFTLYPEAVLAGRVVSAVDDRPVARARITLETVSGDDFTADSGPDGTFTLRQLPAGTFFVAVTHRDHARLTEKAREFEEGEKVEGVLFKLPAGLTAVGTVVDSASQAVVANAQVFFDVKPESAKDDEAPAPRGAGFRRSGQSNAEGRFELAGLGEGEYLVSVRASGYLPPKPLTVVVLPGQATDTTLALTLGGSISGRILDADKNPVAGAVARLVIQSGPGMSWNDALSSVYNLSATSDAEGNYRLVGLPAYKGYGAQASHPGHPDVRVTGLEVELEQPLQGIDLEFPRGGSLRGRVVDEIGTVLAGVIVQAVDTKLEAGEGGGVWYSRGESREKSATTDSAGRFALDHLHAGVYTVKARAINSMSATQAGVVVTAERPTEGLELVLGAGERLRGRVTDVDGEPIAQASVSIAAKESAQTSTDVDGRFEVKGLARGEVTVSVNRASFDSKQVKVAVPATAEMHVQLDRLAKISGTLRAQEGMVFKNYRITAVAVVAGQEEGFRGGREWSINGNDPAGAFEIEVKAGTYKLQAHVEKLVPGESPPITVVAGERVTGIVIDLERGGTIEGLVVSRGNGAVIEGVNVHVQETSSSNRNLFARGAPTSRTDAEGRFKLQGIPDLAVNVIAQHDSFAQATVKDIRVAAGETTQLRIELALGGILRGIVRKGGAPQAQVNVFAQGVRPGESAAWKGGQTDAAGRFELKGVAAGDYLVRATSSGKRQLQIQGSATVYEGQTTEIELDQELGIVVSGRVTVGGVPVGGGHIEVMQRQPPRPVGNTSIDANGNYVLEVPVAGAYALMVTTGGTGRPGSARTDLDLPPGAAEYRQDIDLPAGQLVGLVYDAASGEPLGGAQALVTPEGVAFRSLATVFSAFKGTASTGDDGRFELVALEAGVYSVRVFRAGYADTRLDGVRVDGRPGPAELRVPLERGISCRLYIVDGGGAPIQGAMVFLRAESGDLVQVGRPLLSNASGVVDVSGIRSGTYEASTLHRSYAPARLVFAAAEAAEAVLTLSPGARLEVEVVSRRGAPVVGATADVIDKDGTNLTEDAGFLALMGQGQLLATGANGTLTLEQVPPGKHRVTARTDRGRSREERVTVELGKVARVRLVVDE